MTDLDRDGLRRYLQTFDTDDDAPPQSSVQFRVKGDVAILSKRFLCQQCGCEVRAVWDDEAGQHVIWKHVALDDGFKICEGSGREVGRDG